jgi:hypothetical protein
MGPKFFVLGCFTTTDLLSGHKEQFISKFLAYCRNVNGSKDEHWFNTTITNQREAVQKDKPVVSVAREEHQ